MPELRSILEHWRENASAPGVLATVVHVRGSAYRRPGARMLLLEDGRRIGSISGGCLEGDLSKKAWWWTSSGKPAVRVYDTSSDEDAVWEFGLGCNGIIDVLLERIDSPEAQELLKFADEARSSRTGAIVATVIRCGRSSSASIGDRLLYRPDAGSRGALQRLEPELLPAVTRALDRRANCLFHLDDLDVFIEWIGAPQRLFLFGAGHDAQPVVEMASSLGWAVTVADGRPAYTCKERFPKASGVFLIPPSADISKLGIDRDSAIVLMTHNFPQDERLLRQILPCEPRYLGLLGPMRRTERLFQQLGLNPADFSVHAPVGLDIGADSPEAIALSIVAELQSMLAGREGGFLRLRRQKIHSDVEEIGSGTTLAAPSAGLLTCEVSLAVHG